MRFNIAMLMILFVAMSSFAVTLFSLRTEEYASAIGRGFDGVYEITLEDSPKGIRAMSSSEEEKHYTIMNNGTAVTGDFLIEGVEGGSIIEFKEGDDKNVVVTIGDNILTFNPDSGYRIADVKLSAKATNGAYERHVTATHRYDDKFDADSNGIRLDANLEVDPTNDTTMTFTPENIDITYSGSITLSVSVDEIWYRAGLYYPDKLDATNKKYVKHTEFAAYTISQPQDLSEIRLGDKDEVFFMGWALGIPEDDDRYSISGNDSTNKTVNIVSKGKWIFEYDRHFTETKGETNYNIFYIKTIKGNENFYNEDTVEGTPYIIARWSYRFELTIANTSADMIGTQNTSNQYLAGAYSSTTKGSSLTSNTQSKQTTIKIQDGYYGLGFQSSAGEAFHIYDASLDYTEKNKVTTNEGATNFEEEWYYVYNYGSEISGWYVYFTVSNVDYYLVYGDDPTTSDVESDAWYPTTSDVESDDRYPTDTKNKNDISKLSLATSTTDLAYCAERLDRFNLFQEKDLDISSLSLTMYPEWNKVNIQPKYGETNLSDTITYGNANYTLNGVASDYQSFTHFITKSGNPIPTNGDWTYRNIVEGDYTYTGGGALYNISLTPQFASNIYKVYLDVDGTLDTNKCRYTAYPSGDVKVDVKVYNETTKPTNNYYTFDSELTFGSAQYISIPEFDASDEETSGKSSMEVYATEFVSQVNAYKNKITADNLINDTSFNIFNTVYESDVEDYPYYIYLVNGHSVKYMANGYQSLLPIFNGNNAGLLNAWVNNDICEVDDETIRYFYPTKDGVDEEDLTYIDELGATMTKNDVAWECAHGGSEGSFVLVSNHDQSYYLFTIDTRYIDVGQYGYAIIKLKHKGVDNKGVDNYYLVIDKDNNKTAELYNITNVYTEANWSLNKINIDTYSNITMYVIAGDVLTITAYDQSNDTVAMESGKYDSMIGYRHSSISCEGLPTGYESLFSYTTGSATLEITSGLLDKKNSGESFNIHVNFEPIQYSLNFAIDDQNAGSYTVSGVTEQNGVANNITVTNAPEIKMDYVAEYGYEFATNNFTFNNSTVGITADQYHQFIFNGTWLREKFYNDTDSYPTADTELGTLKINTAPIEFTYKVKIYNSAITDSTAYTTYDVADSQDNFSVRDELTNKLTKMVELNINYPTTNTADDTEGVNKLITKKDVLGYVFSNGITKYAILNSSLRGSTGNTTDNYTYTFLLSDIVDNPQNKAGMTESITIDPTKLGSLVGNGEGVIITNRVIYMQLEVREIYDIRVLVVHSTDDPNYTDPNYADRTITVGVPDRKTNTSKTSYEMTLSNKANHSTEYYQNSISKDANHSTEYYQNSMVFYTYQGLENLTIISQYNEKYYTGVSYQTSNWSGKGEGSTLTSPFSVTAGKTDSSLDQSIVVKFVPKQLPLEIKFKLDGVEKTQKELLDYATFSSLPEVLKKDSNENILYSYNEKLGFKYQVSNSDYTSVLYHGGSQVDLIKPSDVDTAVTVDINDFEREKIEIVIDIKIKDNSQIIVRYDLGTDQLPDSEPYGKLFVVITNTDDNRSKSHTMADGESSVTTNVIISRKLEVNISGMATGYQFMNKVLLNGNEVEFSLNGNIITITESFDPETHGGTYTILLSKREYTATLDVSDSTLINASDRQSSYGFSVNVGDIEADKTTDPNAYTINGTYLGMTLTMSAKELDTEVINGSFYYMNHEDQRVDIPTTKNASGWYVASLTITSALLEDLGSEGLKFHFDTFSKFKLDIVAEGGEYIESGYPRYTYTKYDAQGDILVQGGVQYTGTYTSSSYVIEGSYISVEVNALVETKYSIGIMLESTQIIEDADVVKMLDVDNATAEATDDAISLTSNMTLKIIVSPREYSIVFDDTTTDYVYNDSSESIETEELKTVVNNGKEGTYNTTQTLSIVKENTERSLSNVTISGNDSVTIVLDFDNSVYKYVDEDENEQIVQSLNELTRVGYNISIGVDSNTGMEILTVEYNVLNDMTIETDYIAKKEISPIK